MGTGNVWSHVGLCADDVAFLKKLSADLSILADVCRADLLLYCSAGPERAILVAQALPHSVSPLYDEGRVGQGVRAGDQAEVLRALHGAVGAGPKALRRVATILRLSNASQARGLADPAVVHTVEVRGATVARQVFPVYGPRGGLIAVLAMDSYWLAHERHRRRSRAFQRALGEFIWMVLRGDLQGVEGLTPFGEHDGIVYVGADRHVQYMSGIAAGLYRHLGYRDSLVGRRITELETIDADMVSRALTELRCLERQDEQFGLTWIRRVLPVTDRAVPLHRRVWHRLCGNYNLQGPQRPRGALIMVHDATEALQTQRELESKMALVREVHHRVKNNLQVIASIMRMQSRRVQSAEARMALEESVNRILSVAVVHEFLSQNAQGTINLQEVARRILAQVQQDLVDPDKRITLSVKGSAIWLPAERVTQCALVINELVQNAIEHGIAEREEGSVEVELVDHGDGVDIHVLDDGEGLPEGFDLGTDANLGLRIVRSMVERDLRGQFKLSSADGTRATVHLQKSVVGGG